jgi:hypothetical protein
MPAGKDRGILVIFGFGSCVAQVAEVAVGKDGRVRVERVIWAIDCGRIANPETVRARHQLQCQDIALCFQFYVQLDIESIMSRVGLCPVAL